MSALENAAREIHSVGCQCDGCEPYRRDPRVMTDADRVGVMMIAGAAIGVALCEAYALLAHAPHVTVLFGGNG